MFLGTPGGEVSVSAYDVERLLADNNPEFLRF